MGALFAPAALSRWALAGLACSIVQTIVLGLQYRDSEASPSLLVCFLLSCGFLFLYLCYWASVRRGEASLSSPLLRQLFTPAKRKWFILTHLLVATYYFWIALDTFLLHSVGYQFFALFDTDPSGGDVAAETRHVIAALAGTTFISLVNDIITTRYHAARLSAIGGGVYSAVRAGADRPRLLSFIAVAVDIALLVLTGLSLSLQRDGGTYVLLFIIALSLLLEARYALVACSAASVDAPWHAENQLLALQHTLIASTAFLVNLLLLCLWSVGESVPAIVANDLGSRGAIILASLLAYVGMVGTSCVLVGLHAAAEAADGAEGAEPGGMSPAASSGSSYAYGYSSLAVAVPLPSAANAHASPTPALAVAVSLGGDSPY